MATRWKSIPVGDRAYVMVESVEEISIYFPDSAIKLIMTTDKARELANTMRFTADFAKTMENSP